MMRVAWLSLCAIAIALLASCAPAPAGASWTPGAPLPTIGVAVLYASPTPAEQTPAPGQAETPAPAPGLAATQQAASAGVLLAQATAQAAQHEVAVATANAVATETGYHWQLQQTADAVQIEQAQLALSGTRAAGTATQAAVDLAVAQAASAATATQAAADIQVTLEAGRAIIQATADAASAGRQLQTDDDAAQAGRAWYWTTRVGPLVMLIILLYLAVYAAIAWLHNWATRGAVIETRAGTFVLKRVQGELQVEVYDRPTLEPRGGGDEFTSEAPAAQPAQYTSGGKPATLSPGSAQASRDRADVLRLLRDAMEASSGDAGTIPRYDKMGWTSASDWKRVTDLLLPHIDKGQGKRTILVGAYARLIDLYDAVGNHRVALGTALPDEGTLENA